jgi:glycosyltransferase involved in cell wall biosynthesis
MDTMKVSIILLNYNHGRFIGEALTALVAELDAGDELIVIDDASTDNSLDIITTFSVHCSQLRLVRHTSNRGIVAGMNEGLEAAQNELVYFAASDDRVMPGFLSRARTEIAQHESAALITARTRLMDEAGHDIGILPTALLADKELFLPPHAAQAALIHDDNWLVGAATVYRRTSLKSIGGFRPELGCFCDGFASRVLACQFGACTIPAALVWWRRLTEGYSSSETLDPAREKAIAETARALMVETFASIFPAKYVRRWQARWRFGAQTYRLMAAEQRATRAIIEFLEPLGGPGKILGYVAGKILKALRLIAALTLLGVMRPFDLITVARRRFKLG